VHVSGTTHSNLAKFSVPVTHGRRSVFSDGVNCDKLCTSGFVEFPILGPMAQEIQVRRKLIVTYQGQHGFDTAAYAQPNSPGGSIRPGRSLVSTIVSLVDIKQ